MARVAPVAETTHGMPSSRLTITAWLSGAPTSTTTAAAGTNSGVHDGSVMGATSTSPGSRAVGSLESSTTRALPSATPEHPGTPWSVSPEPRPSKTAASRLAHVEGSGGSPTKTNAGSRSDSSP